MPHPLVSVIVPTHNRADLIRDTLASILAQTFADFEIVILDNGSTDATPEVVKTFQDPRVRYFWQEDSGLPANSRNVAIRKARGKYIAFLDSDDLWLPEKLAVQVPYMEARPQIGLTFTNAEAFGHHGRLGRFNKFRAGCRCSLADLLRGDFIPTLTVVARRTCLDAVGLFSEDPALRGIEDYDLWLRVIARYPVEYLIVSTALYRIHGANLEANDRAANLKKAIGMLECGQYPIGPEEIRQGLVSHYRRLARECAFARDRHECARALQQAHILGYSPLTKGIGFGLRLVPFGVLRVILLTARYAKYQLDDIWAWGARL